ncbi:MAG: ribosome biogenesis GTPase YlqF [Clostridia bacterium]|nr:ribosome biogenesis GTPase YlqF [Clostridia bacterium]
MQFQLPQIQWFPGHMAKTRRMIAEQINRVDVVFELLDARIPQSSSNPILRELLGNKPRIVLLNKQDLADPAVSERWLRYYEKQGLTAQLFDAGKNGGGKRLTALALQAASEKLQRLKARGMEHYQVSGMVLGIPNVGKSSLINRLSSGSKAKAEDRPGVTRDKQWIEVSRELRLLDTPGVLWPKFEQEETALHLAYTGAIRDEVMDVVGVAMALCGELARVAPQPFCARYRLENVEGLEPPALFEAVAKKRGFLMAGGVIDEDRCARILLDEFRGGKIGRISLEQPAEEAK